MAIITVSRQYFSLGHKICKALAQITGYKLYDRQSVFEKIIELGCPEDKVRKFDEIKPGLLPSLSKYNDEYLYYLKTAVLSIAEEGNCIIEGRGGYSILKEIPNHVDIRIFESRENRVQHAMGEYNCDVKRAEKIVSKADRAQFGFMKYYFNENILLPMTHNLIINSGNSTPEACASAIKAFTETFVDEEKESRGKELLSERLLGQKIINMLRFIYFVDIDSMRAEVKNNVITLYGVASTKGIVDNAIKIINCEIGDYDVVSKIRVVQGGMGER